MCKFTNNLYYKSHFSENNIFPLKIKILQKIEAYDNSFMDGIQTPHKSRRDIHYQLKTIRQMIILI